MLARIQCKALFISAGALALIVASARANLVINPVWDSTITSDPNSALIESGINQTIQRFEATLANNVTVNIKFAEMTTGLGQSNAFYTSGYTYTTYLNNIQNHQTISSYDQTAISSLASNLNFPYPANPVNGGANIRMTTDLADLWGANNHKTDIISINTQDTYLDRNNIDLTGNSGFIDIQAVAAHEIDECLGVGGGGSDITNPQPGTLAVGPTDLYRYSAAHTRSWTPVPGTIQPYFSIDGGVTKLSNFNGAGAFGSDYGDWGSNFNADGTNKYQVQDAFGQSFTNEDIGSNELISLDVVGWDLTPLGQQIESGSISPFDADFSAPEPFSVAILAPASILLLIRRKK